MNMPTTKTLSALAVNSASTFSEQCQQLLHILCDMVALVTEVVYRDFDVPNAFIDLSELSFRLLPEKIL
jgi:hypothetical protein